MILRHFNMEYILFFDITVQAIAFLIVFWMLYKKDEKDKEHSELLLRNSFSTQKETTQTFMEQIAKIEKIHFETNEKQTGKQLKILEENTRHFLSAMTEFTIAMQPKPVPLSQPVPDLLDKTERKNTIEEEQPKEYFLDEISRIPNINDMKVKILDEDRFFGEEIEQ